MSEPNGAKPSDKKIPPFKQSAIAALKRTAFAVFVFGTAIICFGTARNTIMWNLESIWEATGDLWQEWWTKIHGLFDGDEFLLSFVGTYVVSLTVYWVLGALYLFVDLTGRPNWAFQYKIQDGSNQPLDRKKLIHSLKFVLFNQIVVGGAISLVLHPVYSWRGCSFGPELPSFQRALFEIAICILVEEVGFYYSHRLLHVPRIFRSIHKFHHEWTAPIGIVSFNAHPLEHLVCNVGPAFMGPLIMGSHITTVWLWLSLALVTSINSHSGYHVPFMPSPEAHDFHHLKFTQNFGVLGVLDRLHGTDALFRKSRAYDRHIMLFGFTPLKQTFPDHKPKKGSPNNNE